MVDDAAPAWAIMPPSLAGRARLEASSHTAERPARTRRQLGEGGPEHPPTIRVDRTAPRVGPREAVRRPRSNCRSLEGKPIARTGQLLAASRYSSAYCRRAFDPI